MEASNIEELGNLDAKEYRNAVRGAFEDFSREKHDSVWRPDEIFFEHDQWWARAYPDDDQEVVTYSVVECESPAETYLDFEEI